MNPPRASDLLTNVVTNHTADSITLLELKLALHERGFGILMVLFVIPCCLPVPVPPGVPLIFSIPLLFLSFQMILGYPAPWLPRWVAKKSIKRTTLAFMIEKSAPVLRRIEHFLRPRLSFASTKRGERVVGLFIFIFAAIIALPLPLPFSNFVPGIGILIMSLGLLGKDGLMILLGMLVGTVGCALVIAALILGVKVVDKFISSVFGYFNF